MVCQLFEYCTRFHLGKPATKTHVLLILYKIPNIRRATKHVKKNLPCVITIPKHRPGTNRANNELIPGVSSSKASSYRSKKSPALSSFVVTTVTIVLAEPLTCAVYCSVDIAQRKHHSRVHAPVIYHPPPHPAHKPPAPPDHKYTQAHTHTKNHTLHVFLSHATA